MRSLLVVSLLLFLSFYSSSCFAIDASSMEELSRGGPFVAGKKRIQRFAGKFEISKQDLDRPLVVVFHNGPAGAPGFNWLRVFLAADVDIEMMGQHDEPNGELLIDETNVQSHTINLDLSDRVHEGVNTLIVEGTGPKGAVLSWTLYGRIPPRLSRLNPRQVHPGSRLVLHGTGFSGTADSNTVHFGDNKAEILRSDRSSLVIRVPESIGEGQHKVAVSSNGIKGEPVSMTVIPSPRLDSVKETRYGNNRALILAGANFSCQTDENQVLFDGTRARIVKTGSSSLEVLIPDSVDLEKEQTVRVSLFVRGIPAGAIYWGKSN